MSNFDNVIKEMEKKLPVLAALAKKHQNDKITISFREFVEKSADITSEIAMSQTSDLMEVFTSEICQRFIAIFVREFFARGSFDGSEGTNT